MFAGPGAGIALSGLLAVYIHAKRCRPGPHGRFTACWHWCLSHWLPAIYRVPGNCIGRAARLNPYSDERFEVPVWSYSPPDLATSCLQHSYRKWRPCVFRQPVCTVCLADIWRCRCCGDCAQYRFAPHLYLEPQAGYRAVVTGAGVLAAWLLPGIGGLLTGGLLVGGGFLCAVQLSLLYGRELAPEHTRYMAGLLTTGYAIGQLVGPMTSALSTGLPTSLSLRWGWRALRCSLRARWCGTVRPKGSSNCNNYRREYWIMCAASRTMSAHFCHNEGKRRHTCRRKECHHSVKKRPLSTKPGCARS